MRPENTMKTSSKNLLTPAIACVAVLLATTGCGPAGISHTLVEEPKTTHVFNATDAGIGQITSTIVVGSNLLVAGSAGIAMVGADGKPLWQTQLPQAHVRLVAADASGIAWTSYSVGKKEEHSTSMFLIGGLNAPPNGQEMQLGLVDTQGTPKWSTTSAGTGLISPPTLGQKSVAFTVGDTFTVVSRDTGATLKSFDIGEITLGMASAEAIYASTPRLSAWYHNGNYYLANGYKFSLIGEASLEMVTHSRGPGGLEVYGALMAGPITINDTFIFAAAAHPTAMIGSNTNDYQPGFFGVDLEGENTIKFNADIDTDYYDGVGAITTNGTSIFAAADRRVIATDLEGDQIWEVWNGETNGAITPNSVRNVRFQKPSVGVVGALLGASSGASIPMRLGTTQQMAATTTKVFVSSVHGTADAITVLDAGKGTYLNTINIGESIVELALLEQTLVVATPNHVFLMPTN